MPEIGYGGSVGEANWSTLAPNLGVEYTVDGYGDWLATTVPLSDRTLALAPGTGTGKGITDTTTAPVSVTLAPVGSGFRWDLICRHRNTAGAGGTSSFVVIEGTDNPLAVFGSRELFGPTSTEDDQPLWLARVDAGSGLITDLKDVRIWQGNNGAVARAGQGDYPLQYLTKLGSTVQIGDALYVRTFAADGVGVTWRKYSLQPSAAQRRWTAGRGRPGIDTYGTDIWAPLCAVNLPADAPAGEYSARFTFVGGSAANVAMAHDLLIAGPGGNSRMVPMHFVGTITQTLCGSVPFTHVGGAGTFLMSAKSSTPTRAAFVINPYTVLDVHYEGPVG